MLYKSNEDFKSIYIFNKVLAAQHNNDDDNAFYFYNTLKDAKN